MDRTGWARPICRTDFTHHRPPCPSHRTRKPSRPVGGPTKRETVYAASRQTSCATVQLPQVYLLTRSGHKVLAFPAGRPRKGNRTLAPYGYTYKVHKEGFVLPTKQNPTTNNHPEKQSQEALGKNSFAAPPFPSCAPSHASSHPQSTPIPFQWSTPARGRGTSARFRFILPPARRACPPRPS